MPENYKILKTLEKPEKDFFIYGLIDPDTKELVYIGQTSRGFKRIREHYGECYKRSSRYTFNNCKLWIQKLRKENKIFDVIYLEYCEFKEELTNSEIFYYEYFKSLGCNLLNFIYPGQEHNNIYTANSISEATKRAMANPEVRKKLRDSHLGQISPRKGIRLEINTKIKISKNNPNIHYIIDEIGNIFAGTDACAEFWKIGRNIVQHYLKGRTKTAKGHDFKYIDKTLIDKSKIIYQKYLKAA